MGSIDALRCAGGMLVLVIAGQVASGDGPPSRATQPIDRIAASGDAPTEQAGVGVAWRRSGGQFFVNRVLPGTPAAHSGKVHKGDHLLAVAQANQAPVHVLGMPMEKVVAMIRGPKGTVVKLSIVPAGKSEAGAIVVPLIRGSIAELNRLGDDQFVPVGMTAPNFEAVSLLTGEKHRLKDWRGKTVVLEFSCSGCAPCLKQIAELEKLYHENRGWKNRVQLVVVAVDEERTEAAKWVRESLRNSREIRAVWSGSPALKTFHIGGLPTVYVLDEKGRVVAAGHSIDIERAIERTLSE
jgi:thiol-disulfide isomerase/thioredoxin